MFKNIISAFLVTFAFSASYAMISDGQPAPGYYSLDDEEDALTVIQVFEGNMLRIFDRRPDDHVNIVEGTFKVTGNHDIGYDFEVKIAKQRSMDGSGEITDYSAKEVPFKSVKIHYSVGVLYPIVKVRYVHRDGHTSSDEKVLYKR